MDVYLYTFDQTLRVNTKVNYGLWMIMMCQCGFILDNKCISLMSNIDPGEGYTCVGAGVYIYIWKSSVPSFQFFCEPETALKKYNSTSLVTQWMRIQLPMQGTWVQSLVRGDSTCYRETKPMCHNYWACVLQLLKLLPATCALQREATAMRSRCTTTKSSHCSPQLEKACMQQWNTVQPK